MNQLFEDFGVAMISGLLLLAGEAMSLPATIGILMLMGIVTKNLLLLVEYALVAREKGASRREAMLDACHKRARPILMTTVAMGAGMLPIALKMGADADIRAPMAIAVIGGLITSTVLSLFRCSTSRWCSPMSTT